MVSGAVAPSSSFNKPNFDDWRITVYTGDKMWSGTDSMVYVQVHGEIDSQIFQVIRSILLFQFYFVHLLSELSNTKINYW